MKRALPLIALLTACTHTSTGMLDDRTMILSGSGNAFTSMAQVQQSVMRRAATEAQRRGFTHFVILDAADASSTGSYTTPTETTGTATGTTSCMGVFCNTNVTGQATTYGGQTYFFNRPGADVTVRFLTAEEAAQVGGAWSVASVLAASADK